MPQLEVDIAYKQTVFTLDVELAMSIETSPQFAPLVSKELIEEISVSRREALNPELGKLIRENRIAQRSIQAVLQSALAEVGTTSKPVFIPVGGVQESVETITVLPNPR